MRLNTTKWTMLFLGAFALAIVAGCAEKGPAKPEPKLEHPATASIKAPEPRQVKEPPAKPTPTPLVKPATETRAEQTKPQAKPRASKAAEPKETPKPTMVARHKEKPKTPKPPVAREQHKPTSPAGQAAATVSETAKPVPRSQTIKPAPAPQPPRPRCPAGGKEKVVRVTGLTRVMKGDLAQAREEALTDARVRAVEEAAGVTVNSRAVLYLELLAASSVDLKSHGTILTEKVLQQGVGPDGLYRLELEATVCANKVEERIAGLLRPDIVVVAVEEDNLGEPVASPRLKAELITALQKAGFQRIELLKPKGDLEKLGVSRAKALGRRYMADLVIVGKLASRASSKIREGFYSAHGQGWLRVFRVKEGRMAAAAQAQAVRGFGQNMEAAGRQALGKTGQRLLAQAMKALTDRNVRDLTVQVEGLADLNAFKRFKSLLALTRWVQKVEGARFSAGTGLYQLRYADKAEMLATFLDRLPGYTVDGFSEKKVIIKYAQ